MNKKTEMSQYLPENPKTVDFNPWRTLSGSFFAIPEYLASICAIVLAFTANKQTNKHSIIYYRFMPHVNVNYLLMKRAESCPNIICELSAGMSANQINQITHSAPPG